MPFLPIRAWCDALNLTQSDLARRAGLPAPVVSDYARGKRNPTLRTIEALAKALDRDPWEFLRGPKSGEGLPTEEESREQNLAWFSRLTPSQKERVSDLDREYLERVGRLHAH